jgi:hypothetical protein
MEFRSSQEPSPARAGGPGEVLVRKPVIRMPSASVMRSCALRCGRSLRRINWAHAGHANRSTRAATSATHAPSRGLGNHDQSQIRKRLRGLIG